MKKLEAIREALLGLAEELEAEEARLNSITDRVIARANGLVQEEGLCETAACDRFPLEPHIRFKVLEYSLEVEGALVAPEASGKGELVIKALPRLIFLLDGPNDLALMQRIRAIFREFQLMSAGESHAGYRSLGEFKFLLSFFTTASG